MTTTYRVIINGIKTGASRELALSQLATLFKTSEVKVAAILADPGFIAKRGIELQMAAKYEAALKSCGCVCTIESESAAELDFDEIPKVSIATNKTVSTSEIASDHSKSTVGAVSTSHSSPEQYRVGLFLGKVFRRWKKSDLLTKIVILAVVTLLVLSLGLEGLNRKINSSPQVASKEVTSKQTNALSSAASTASQQPQVAKVDGALRQRCVGQARQQGYRSGQCAYSFIDACIRTQNRQEMEATLRTDAMLGMGSAISCPNMPATYVQEFNQF